MSGHTGDLKWQYIVNTILSSVNVSVRRMFADNGHVLVVVTTALSTLAICCTSPLAKKQHIQYLPTVRHFARVHSILSGGGRDCAHSATD